MELEFVRNSAVEFATLPGLGVVQNFKCIGNVQTIGTARNFGIFSLFCDDPVSFTDVFGSLTVPLCLSSHLLALSLVSLVIWPVLRVAYRSSAMSTDGARICSQPGGRICSLSGTGLVRHFKCIGIVQTSDTVRHFVEFSLLRDDRCSSMSVITSARSVSRITCDLASISSCRPFFC